MEQFLLRVDRSLIENKLSKMSWVGVKAERYF